MLGLIVKHQPMIRYEEENSPFFSTNQTYCQQIEEELSTLGAETKGFCNSFGYEVEASFQKDELLYRLIFEKHQTTQGGIVPVNANDYAGLAITIKGIPVQYNCSIGQSKLKRVFMRPHLKTLLPSPYFIFLANKETETTLPGIIKLIPENKISSLELKNGKLECTIHEPIVDIGRLIETLDLPFNK